MEDWHVPSEIFDNTAQSGVEAFGPYSLPWRNEADSQICGGGRGISTRDRAYRKRLTQMAKDAKLSLLWVVANSHLET